MSQTITSIPIVETGIEYPTSTGKVTFTTEDLAAIVESQSDPAIVAPRLKLGHSDVRFNSMDGEPAFGVAKNLRLDNNGNTVLCDYVGVPDWLAEVLPTAYPNRSIEGNWDEETVTGHKWQFVVTAVALLGVVWPGVSTLDDLEVALSDEGPEGVSMATQTVTVHVDGKAIAESVAAASETVSDTPWGNFSDSDYDDAQYTKACVYDRGKCSDAMKDATAKQRYSLPVREPSGTLNRNGVHSAAGYIGQVTGGCAAAKKAAATTLVNMYKNSLKEDPPDALTQAAASIMAAVNMEDVRRSFYDDVATKEEDRFWWWIRAVMLDPNEVIVDDDEGGLYRIPFSTDKKGQVTWQDPVPVKIKYVDQPVSASKAGQVIASAYASSTISRPYGRISVNVDREKLKKVLGMSGDATEDDIRNTLAEKSEEPGEVPPHTTTETEQDDSVTEGEESGETTETEEESATTENVAASSGAVLVDRETLNTLQRNANMGVQAFERQRKADRDSYLHAAVHAGKFPPARLNHWTEAWDRDPEGIKAQIDSMPAGLIPVGQLGIAPNEEGETSPAYSPHLFPQLARKNLGTVTQES